jgi:tripeptide aminopeptidase
VDDPTTSAAAANPNRIAAPRADQVTLCLPRSVFVFKAAESRPERMNQTANSSPADIWAMNSIRASPGCDASASRARSTKKNTTRTYKVVTKRGAVVGALRSTGVPAAAIRFDSAHERIPLPTQTGNLIVSLPGTRAGPHMAFATHLDTVPLCAGAKPERRGRRIVGDGTTALGGDDRTGCAVLVALAESLLRHHLPHPPITLIFTLREESRLMGARNLDPAELAGIELAFNVDGKVPAELITGAVGGATWELEVRGKASHAGVAPEKGISATLAAAIGIAEAHRGGWFGKVVKPAGRGTSNVGVFGGRHQRSAGNATNVVTDYVHIDGESRSDDEAFTSTITRAFEQPFVKAAAQVRDDDGGPPRRSSSAAPTTFPSACPMTRRR